jgi:hypothetical protein
LPKSRLARFAYAVALLALAGAVQWIDAHDWRGDPPRIHGWPDGPRSGDEPHYSIILHSLLFDGDFELGDDYDHAAKDGYESGRFWRGSALDHHTILLDRETGRNVTWQSLWKAWERRPCDEPGCVPFAPREPHGFEDLSRVVEVPAHPPAFPMILAAALYPFSPEPRQVDQAAAYVLRWVGSFTLVATFAAGLAAGLPASAALGASAVLGLASPYLAYTKSFFSEGMATAIAAAALAALLAGFAWLAALFAVVAMWVKPALVVLGAGFLAERAWARDWRQAAWIAGVMTVGGLALIAFNFSLAHRPLLSGGVAWAPPSGLTSAWGTLVDKQHGLLPFAPWVAVVAVGLGWRAPGPTSERLRLAVGIPALLHWALVSTYGALGGTCYGPRYWIPFLAGFAVCAAALAREGGRAVRVGLAVTVPVAAILSVTSALVYLRVWNDSPYHGLMRIGGDLLGR